MELRSKALKAEIDGKQYSTWLISNTPYCRSCIKHGQVEPSNVLDHITPIRDGGDVFAESNLQWLCSSCHNTKSNHDKNKRTTSSEANR